MSEEHSSFLIINLQRETAPESGQFSNRELRAHFISPGGDKAQYLAGYTQYFEKIGSRVAFVTHYEEGMIEKLRVNAVVETPDILLNEPLIVEQNSTNMHGMTLGYDESRLDPNRSMESVMLVDGGPFTGPLQAGFIPQQEAILPIGKTLDGKAMQLVFQDARPMPAMGMTSSSLK